MSKKRSSKKQQPLIVTIISIVILVFGYFNYYYNDTSSNRIINVSAVSLDEIPEYTVSPYVTVNNNVPNFTEEDYTTEAFEEYSDFDDLGRCGVAYANICIDIMPADGEKRGEIGNIKPSGWNNAKYEGLVEGNYLYNRCHLIGWQLAGENDNGKNLITGTRYMNVQGMLPFENMVDDYIEENTNNHVLYRVTPIFKDDDLVARGVQMEAYSVEDNGEGVCFNVYVYNVQPGVIIDYSDGFSAQE